MLESIYKRFSDFSSRNMDETDISGDYNALFQVQREHRLVNVSFESNKTLYQSIILSIDPQSQTLCIDELFPTDFIASAGQHCKITVNTEGGRRFAFESVIISHHSESGGTPFYTISMPDNLSRTQRREAFRFVLPKPSPVRFKMPDQEFHEAHAADISATGLQVHVDGLIPGELEPNMVLTNFTMGINQLQLACDIKVKHIVESEVEGDTMIRLGCEFVGLNRMTERFLEKEITKLQRYGLVG